MKRYIHRGHSIYIQMMILLIVATVAAVGFFFVLDQMSEYPIGRYLEESDYIETRIRKSVAGFQEYAAENRIHSRDAENIYKWVQEQRLISLSIYKDGIQVFDSAYPYQQIWDQEIAAADYDWIKYDTIRFEDGIAEIMISGAWSYQVYSCVQKFEIGLSFLAFLVIVLLGIRKKMSYIRQLNDEVEVLEGGCLNCPITVRGCDELSVLAEGLDSMRRTFLDSQKREAEMIRDHQQVITEMSHDLRTPVTAIMLYAEILLAGKIKDDNQKKQYIQKIDQKALQLKERTDSLLNYSLGTCKETKTDMEEEAFSEVFYDLLSETSCYLEQRGFRTEMHVRWTDLQIRYNTDYLVRIMDNIMSNIVKYADPEYPITIDGVERKDEIGLLFQNRIAVTDETVEGNRIGIQSIRSMMKEMGGSCRSECKDKVFRVELMFPLV